MRKQLFIIPVFFSIFSSIVFAKNILDSLFKPFFGWNIESTYNRASAIIDFILYTMIFLYISRYAIGKRFDGPTAKSLSVVVAIALALGMAVFSAKMGFKLGNLGPLAALIFFAVMGMIAYNVLKGFGAGTPAAGAFAFILVYFTLKMAVPQFFVTLENLGDGIVGALIQVGILIAVFTAMIGLFTSIKGSFSGTPEGDTAKAMWDLSKKGAGKVKEKWKDRKNKGETLQTEEEAAEDEVAEEINEEEDKLKNIMTLLDSDINQLDLSYKNLLGKESYLNSEIEKQMHTIQSEYVQMQNNRNQMVLLSNRLAEIKRDNKFGLEEEIKSLENNFANLAQRHEQYNATLLTEAKRLESYANEKERERIEMITKLDKMFEEHRQKDRTIAAMIKGKRKLYDLLKKKYLKSANNPNKQVEIRTELEQIAEQMKKLTTELKDTREKEKIIVEEIKEEKKAVKEDIDEKKILKEIKSIVNAMNNLRVEEGAEAIALMKDRQIKFKEALEKLYKKEMRQKASNKKISNLHKLFAEEKDLKIVQNKMHDRFMKS